MKIDYKEPATETSYARVTTYRTSFGSGITIARFAVLRLIRVASFPGCHSGARGAVAVIEAASVPRVPPFLSSTLYKNEI